MRVLHLGNTGNIAYQVARALRQLGVEATVLVDRSDFITGEPSWEDEECLRNGDNEWIQYYRNTTRHHVYLGPLGSFRFPYYHRLQQALDLNKLAASYDILQAYDHDVILCLTQWRKPFLAFCIGGDLNVTALSPTMVGWLMRRAYRRARLVFYSNINMARAVQQLELERAHFMPLPVDIHKYIPNQKREAEESLKEQLNCSIVLFSPSRHAWSVKGNDKMLYSFARLQKDEGMQQSVKLVLCEWGEDLHKSRALCEELGLGPSVVWFPLMPKKQLLRLYQGADIVLDQFNLGAFGLITLEAMACGKPVILNCSLEHARACYPEPPPIIHASTAEEIYNALRRLIEQPEERLAHGRRARQWVVRHHSSEVVAQKHLDFYKEILSC